MAHFDAGRFAGLRATAFASFKLWGLSFDYFEAVMTAVDVVVVQFVEAGLSENKWEGSIGLRLVDGCLDLEWSVLSQAEALF